MSCLGRIGRFPWFMLLVFLLITSLTIGQWTQASKAHENTKMLLSLFNGIDGILEDISQYIRVAMAIVWSVLGANAIGLLAIGIIMTRSAARSEHVVQSVAEEETEERLHYGYLSSMVFGALVLLSYLATVMASLIMTLQAAWLGAFMLVRAVGQEALDVYRVADEALDVWEALVSSSRGQQATELLGVVKDLQVNLNCDLKSLCNDQTRRYLKLLRSAAREVQKTANQVSTLAGQNCTLEGDGCLGIPIPFFADNGCVCEAKLVMAIETADTGLTYAKWAFVFSVLALPVWLIYYGRTASNMRKVRRDNYWGRHAALSASANIGKSSQASSSSIFGKSSIMSK